MERSMWTRQSRRSFARWKMAVSYTHLDVYKRQSQGRLYRERPFVMSLPAREVWADAVDEDPVFVQGIVDVFWVEADGIVLLDYKTDRVDDPKELIRRYQIQLKLYAQALSRVFDGIPIKEILIYSFHFGKAFPAAVEEE